MKRIALLLLVCVNLLGGVNLAQGQVRIHNTSDNIAIAGQVLDSAGEVYVNPDSVEITVIFQDGTEAFAATWYNTADAQAADVGSYLVYDAAFDDIDGAKGLGRYEILAKFTYIDQDQAKTWDEMRTLWVTYDSVVIDGSVLAGLSNAISATTIAASAIGQSEIATDAIDADAIKMAAIGQSEIGQFAIDADAVHADLIDKFWNEPRAGHTTQDSYGAGLDTLIANVEAVKSKTDGLNFIGGDVKATLDGELVAVSGFSAGAITASAFADNAIQPGKIAQGTADKIGFYTWNMSHDTAAHFHDSAFGAQWHGWQAGGEGGAGAIPCTLQVVITSGADTTALQGAFLRVYNSDETATAATGTSDANGRAVFSLDAGTFHVYGYQGGYSFVPQPDTVTVSAGGVTDTLWATPFDPGSPATADLCRVYGWVNDLSGADIAGASVRTRVAASPLRLGNLVISPYKLTTTTDSTGYWFLDVIPSGDLTPDTTSYRFEIRYGSGAILRRRVVVPDSTQWFFTW
jgi:hypothetical protein